MTTENLTASALSDAWIESATRSYEAAINKASELNRIESEQTTQQLQDVFCSAVLYLTCSLVGSTMRSCEERLEDTCVAAIRELFAERRSKELRARLEAP